MCSSYCLHEGQTNHTEQPGRRATSEQYGGMFSTNKVRSSGLWELLSARTLCSFTYSECLAALSELNCKDNTARRDGKNNTSASAITQRLQLCRHGRLQISTHSYTHQPGYVTQTFVYEDKAVQKNGVIIRNTRKSSRNNRSLILGVFLLGRRHFDVTFHAGSTTEFPFGTVPLPRFSAKQLLCLL